MAEKLESIAGRMKRQDAVYALVGKKPGVACFALTSAAYLLLSQTNSEVANGRVYKKAVKVTQNRITYRLRDKDAKNVSDTVTKSDAPVFLPRRGREDLILLSPQAVDMARFNAAINARGTKRSLYKPSKQFQRQPLSMTEIFACFDAAEVLRQLKRQKTVNNVR